MERAFAGEADKMDPEQRGPRDTYELHVVHSRQIELLELFQVLSGFFGLFEVLTVTAQ